MNLDKVYKLLNVEQLDENTQQEVQNYLNEMVDMKAKEKAQEISEKAIEDVKEELTEEYEQKFEEYKDDITSKFSDFLDKVIDEQLEIPEKIQEYARKGELYDDLIQQFKVRLGIDEGALDEEARGLMKEAKDEISKLKQSKNDIYSRNLQLEQDVKEFAAQLYLHEKCKGLTENQKDKVFNMLEGITDKAKIDEKFNFVKENILNEKIADEDNDDDDQNLNENKSQNKDSDNKDYSEKGSQKVDESFNQDDNPDPNPFEKHVNSWLNVVKNSY